MSNKSQALSPPTDDVEESMSAIRGLSPIVVKQHTSFEDAKTKERTTSAKLLDLAIEMMMPAMPAILSRIAIGRRVNHGKDKQSDVTSFVWHNRRGIYLAGDSEPHERTDPNGDPGVLYRGKGLYLFETRNAPPYLSVLVYDGFRDETMDRWTANMTDVSHEEAMRSFKVAECLQNIADSLREQIRGGKSKVAAKVMRNEAILSATSALLKQAL